MQKKKLLFPFHGWKGLVALAALLSSNLINPGLVRAEQPCFLDGWIQWVAEMQSDEEVSTSCRASDRCCKSTCTAKSECCESACQTKPGCCETVCRVKTAGCEAGCRAQCGTCETSCVKSKPVYAVRIIQKRVDPCDHCPCATNRTSGVYPVSKENVQFRLATVVQQANHRTMIQNNELHQVIKNQNQQIQQLSQNVESLVREVQNLQQQVQMLRNPPPWMVPPPPVSYPQMPNPYYPTPMPVQPVTPGYPASYPVPATAPVLPTSYPSYNFVVPVPAPQQYPQPPQWIGPPPVPVTSTTEPVVPPGANSNDEIFKFYTRQFNGQGN